VIDAAEAGWDDAPARGGSAGEMRKVSGVRPRTLSGNTLLKEQWMNLLDVADEIRAFISEHNAELKAKETK
jgi:hypothetical protein